MKKLLFICLLFCIFAYGCVEGEKEAVDEPNAIKEASITLDTKNYKGSTSDVTYTLEVSSDKNYEYIYAVLTAKSGLIFSNNLKLTVNGQDAKYTLNEDRTIATYRIADPNWSPIV